MLPCPPQHLARESPKSKDGSLGSMSLLWMKGLKPSFRDGLTAGMCYFGKEGREAVWSPLPKALPSLTKPCITPERLGVRM